MLLRFRFGPSDRVREGGEVVERIGGCAGISDRFRSRTITIGDQTGITVDFVGFSPTFTVRAHGDRIVAGLGH
jgi:hypothetical protein